MRLKPSKLKILILVYAVLILFACTETSNPEPKSSNIDFPDSKLDDATILLTQQGKTSIEVFAVHIERWIKTDSTEASEVDVKFFDSDGILKSNLTANRGIIREKTEQLSVYGDVIAINSDSTVLKTESLFWNPATEMITTDDYVEIIKKNGDILTGYGLKADRNLDQIEILRDIKGKVENPPEPALEENDTE